MKQVVVTGMGLISPAGRGLNDAWNGALSGKTGAAVDDDLVAMGTPVTICCRVPSFDPDEELGRGAAKRPDRVPRRDRRTARERRG